MGWTTAGLTRQHLGHKIRFLTRNGNPIEGTLSVIRHRDTGTYVQIAEDPNAIYQTDHDATVEFPED
jgi:hypothetical protein